MLHGVLKIFPLPSITGHLGGYPKKSDKLEGLWQPVKEVLGWLLDGANYTISLPLAKVAKIQMKLHQILKWTRIKLNDLQRIAKGLWQPVKEVLGWLLDRANYTISLPLAKVAKIQTKLHQILKWTRIKLNHLQKIAGTLLHAAYGIPGGRGLFSPLWRAMKNQLPWIKLTPALKVVFHDFQWLFKEIANKPINVEQIAPSLLNIHSYSDACKYAAGVGVLDPSNQKRKKLIHPLGC